MMSEDTHAEAMQNPRVATQPYLPSAGALNPEAQTLHTQANPDYVQTLNLEQSCS